MFKNLKRKIIGLQLQIATAIVFLGTIPQQSVAAGQVGNGGGGISRGGRPMTFYSAGIIVEPRDLTSMDIPEIDSLTKFLNSNPYISDKEKSELIQKIEPSRARRYFRVKQDQFTDTVKERIIKEYNRISGVDARQITLFAITDTGQGTTYLFPDFYRLTTSEKMAILYHEAFWIMHPNYSYDQIVSAEVTFQAYLQNQASPEYAYRWVDATQSNAALLFTAINLDLQSGILNNLLTESRYIPTVTLLGEEFKKCSGSEGHNKSPQDIKTCFPLAVTYLYRLKTQYPQSFLFNYVYIRFLSGEVQFKYWGDLLWYDTGLDLKNPNIATGSPIFYADKCSTCYIKFQGSKD